MRDRIKKGLEIFVEVLEKIPELRYVGDEVLRTHAALVSREEGMEIGRKLGKVLVAYREITGWGRGLAAPQIGIKKAVFVTYVGDVLQVYLNPEMVKVSEERNLYRELCISSGLLWCDVARPKDVTMKWLDEKGELREEKFEGVMARLVQHEYDHLQGRVNLDVAEVGTIAFAVGNPLEEKLRELV